MAVDNHTTIVGNLVDDPELRFTTTGIAVANLRVAVTPGRRPPEGPPRTGMVGRRTRSGRLSAPARELGGGQPQAQQAAGDQADQRPGLVPGLLGADQQADEGADRRQAEHKHDPHACAPPCV
jgi:Single-strand binding protein family